MTSVLTIVVELTILAAVVILTYEYFVAAHVYTTTTTSTISTSTISSTTTSNSTSTTSTSTSTSTPTTTINLMDNITSFTLYNYDIDTGNTTITNLTGLTIRPGSKFDYYVTLNNSESVSENMSTYELPLYQSFNFDRANSTYYSTIPPKSSATFRFRINTNKTYVYQGPVPILVSHFSKWQTGGVPLGGASGPGAPTGVAAYGIYKNASSTYTISTNEIVGYANISSLEGYAVSYKSLLMPNNRITAFGLEVPYGFGIQLNVVLHVIDKNSSEKNYWLQNIFDITNRSTSGKYGFSFSDSLYNFSGTFWTSSSVKGNGTVGSQYYVYGNVYEVPAFNVTLPLQVGLYTKTTMQGNGFTIYFGYKTNYNNSVVWFNKIFLEDPNVQKAYILITQQPNPPIYDAEFVAANWGYSYYKNLTASLSLFYYNGTTQKFQAFPSLYDFGVTNEEVYNVKVTPVNGYGVLSAGEPHYGPLTNISATVPNFLISSST